MQTISNASSYKELMAIKRASALEMRQGSSRLAVCPDMGGRVFAEVDGLSMHRIDLECAVNPNRPFNNYGGGNFWPAPEGGKYGFNYRGDEWCVQTSINNQPFGVVSADTKSALIQKTVKLENRSGTVVEALMTRDVALLGNLPDLFTDNILKSWISYRTVDSFEVSNEVSTDDALIASWTLEQFDASESTIAFCVVPNPEQAINYDFYEHPRERIAYFPGGFTYRTDGLKAGQIGIKKSAGPQFVGFYDTSSGLVCARQNMSFDDGLYFNIADNDQINGPYSAADNYSIFNSDPDMAAFELETVGSAIVDSGRLKGSRLTSVTTFAIFEEPNQARDFAYALLQGRINTRWDTYQRPRQMQE